MNQQIEERIKIIKRFKSVYSIQEKDPEKKNFWFRMSAGFDYWVVMFLLTFLIFVSFSAIFKIEPINEKWQNSGLLVLMAFALAIKSPYSFIELALLKHVKKIKGLDLSTPYSLNQELKKIITRLNSKKHRLNVVGLPSILIILGGALKVFDLNPYWNYFSYLVLFFSPILIIRINYQISLVRKNLSKFETLIISH
jgi:hypothetical protein